MSEDTKQRFEILKMAREMLNEEYTFKRATDHNRWLAESQEAWTKHQKTIPHPPFAPYPTETDVLEAATVLYNFVHIQEIKVPVLKPVETPPQQTYQPIPEGDFVFPQVEKVVENETKEEQEKKVIKDLLPGWIRRSPK